jgi:hypothetical protein
MRRFAAVIVVLASLFVLAGCEEGSTFVRVTCQLDGGPVVVARDDDPCTYDWQTRRGSVHYEGLQPGHHVVTITAQRFTLVSKNPDVWQPTDVGSATHEWTQLPA